MNEEKVLIVNRLLDLLGKSMNLLLSSRVELGLLLINISDADSVESRVLLRTVECKQLLVVDLFSLINCVEWLVMLQVVFKFLIFLVRGRVNFVFRLDLLLLVGTKKLLEVAIKFILI